MFLSRLRLENFRNFLSLELNFSQENPYTLIVGDNGQGKSNLIESIYLISLLRSFRQSNLLHLINWESSYTRIHASLKSDRHTDIEYFHQKIPHLKKQFKINDKPRKAHDFWGSLKTVLFSPEELESFFLEPAKRRRKLDLLLCQIDKKYLQALALYHKALKHKNALLKSSEDSQNKKKQLKYWNHILIEKSTYISHQRRRVIEYFNQKITLLYREITESPVNVSLSYHTNTDNLADLLENQIDREIAAAKSLFGPHRDDLIVNFDQKIAQSGASRGEKRCLFLALKRLEIDIIEEETGLKPLLLLDDFYSELDVGKQDNFLNILKSHQCLITSLFIPAKLQKTFNPAILHIKMGILSKK